MSNHAFCSGSGSALLPKPWAHWRCQAPWQLPSLLLWYLPVRLRCSKVDLNCLWWMAIIYFQDSSGAYINFSDFSIASWGLRGSFQLMKLHQKMDNLLAHWQLMHCAVDTQFIYCEFMPNTFWQNWNLHGPAGSKEIVGKMSLDTGRVTLWWIGYCKKVNCLLLSQSFSFASTGGSGATFPISASGRMKNSIQFLPCP